MQKNPPGPKSRLPLDIDQTVYFARDPLGFLLKLSEYGDLAHYKVGQTDIYLLNQPEYIREVLVTHNRNFIKGDTAKLLKYTVGEGLLTSEGDFWLRQRRMIQPSFHRERVAAYSQTITDYTDELQANWQDNATTNIAKDMMHLTLEIVTKALLGFDLGLVQAKQQGSSSDSADSNTNKVDPQQLDKAIASINDTAERILIPLPIAELLQRLPLPATRRYEASLSYLDNLVYGIIEQHRRVKGQNDLLSLLIEAQDSEISQETGKPQFPVTMSDKQIRDEVITFFLAGHETTALALTWAWYLLSEHPEVEANLYAELKQVLNGRTPTLANVAELKYTEMVLNEAMRLYPPAWLLSRIVVSDFQMGDYLLLKGSLLFLSPYVMHRHPRYYPDPEKFDPERWQPERRANLPKFAYFPFGGGPRTCIGEPFSRLEAILVLASIAQNWRLQVASGQIIKPKPLVTLRPKNGIIMRLEKRT